MRSSLAILLMIALPTAATAAQAKAPPNCTPAKDAKAAHDGYADRVIHEKTGIRLVLIAPGSFSMGTTRGAHKVTIARPFYIAETEVTNAQYRRFADDVADYDGERDTDPVYDLYLRHWRGQSLMSAADEFPVVWVSWNNVKVFCKWAGLALPSEAQWEYACRAGTTTLYYHGDDRQAADEIGWFLTNSKALTCAVAGRKPNAWGLHDMLGNVWEWCEDDFVRDYTGTPADGSARTEEPRTLTRALRGGSWNTGNAPATSGCAARHNSAPGNASNDFGFRVVLPLD